MAKTTKVSLIGPLAGRTIEINHVLFKKGVAYLHGSESGRAGILRYLRKGWQIKVDDEWEGDPDGIGSENEGGSARNDAGEDIDAKTGDVSETESVHVSTGDGIGDEGSETGRSDIGSGDASRYGREDARFLQVDPRLAGAIQSLDPSNESLWTSQGLPKMTAIEAAYGSAGITRRQVEAAVPGWTRDKATAKEIERLNG